MPKRLSPGHLARAVRRQLERLGHRCTVEWIAKPAYEVNVSDPLIEIRTVVDGDERVLHHSVGPRPGPMDVERIVRKQCDPAANHGATRNDIVLALAVLGHAAIKREDMRPLVHFMEHIHISVPAQPLDMLRRPHDMVFNIYPGKDQNGATAFAWSHRTEDAKRRRPSGKALGNRIGFGLASVLRIHPNGRDILRSLASDFEKALDAQRGGEFTPIMLVGISIVRHGVNIELTSRDFVVKDCDLSHGVTISGNIVTIPGHLPQQIMIAAQGRPLSSMVEGLPIPGTIRMKRVYGKKGSTAVLLDGTAVTPDELLCELEDVAESGTVT